jgi:hypothetical protein
MTINVREVEKIRDGRRHAPEIFRRFKALLHDGATISNDPKRPDFYELQNRDEAFYFYLSPITGEVLLLAVWGPGHGPRPATPTATLSERPDCPAQR